MEFIVEPKEKGTLVKFLGNMDVHGVHKIEKSLKQTMEKIAGGKVVMDLSKVDFVSSAGLRVLVSSLKTVQDQGGSLALSGLKPSVQKVFDIVDMNSMFIITSTWEEAIS